MSQSTLWHADQAIRHLKAAALFMECSHMAGSALNKSFVL